MEKGTLGYIKAYKKRYGTLSLLLFLVIVAMVVGIYLILGSIKHIAVVVPILLTLPFSKVFILWVMVAKYKTLNQEEASGINSMTDGRKNCFVLYDMALSSYESVSYASCIVVDQEKIYLLWGGATQKEYTKDNQRAYVQEVAEKTGCSYEVISVNSVDELLQQMETAELSEEDMSISDDRIRQRLLEISM